MMDDRPPLSAADQQILQIVIRSTRFRFHKADAFLPREWRLQSAFILMIDGKYSQGNKCAMSHFRLGLVEQLQIPGAIRQLNMHIVQQMKAWYSRNPNSLPWQL